MPHHYSVGETVAIVETLVTWAVYIPAIASDSRPGWPKLLVFVLFFFKNSLNRVFMSAITVKILALDNVFCYVGQPLGIEFDLPATSFWPLGYIHKAPMWTV